MVAMQKLWETSIKDHLNLVNYDFTLKITVKRWLPCKNYGKLS